MHEPTMAWVVILVRNPIGAGLSLLAVVAFAAFALSTLEDGSGAVRDGEQQGA